VNEKFRNDRLFAIWRNLITEPVWKYEELPPFLLSQVTKLDLLEASDLELSRVMWFWLRRPKLMFHDSAALMTLALCILISLSIALVNWPGNFDGKTRCRGDYSTLRSSGSDVLDRASAQVSPLATRV
jgi:hypothetical protein